MRVRLDTAIEWTEVYGMSDRDSFELTSIRDDLRKFEALPKTSADYQAGVVNARGALREIWPAGTSAQKPFPVAVCLVLGVMLLLVAAASWASCSPVERHKVLAF